MSRIHHEPDLVGNGTSHQQAWLLLSSMKTMSVLCDHRICLLEWKESFSEFFGKGSRMPPSSLDVFVTVPTLIWIHDKTRAPWSYTFAYAYLNSWWDSFTLLVYMSLLFPPLKHFLVSREFPSETERVLGSHGKTKCNHYPRKYYHSVFRKLEKHKCTYREWEREER